MRSRLFTAKNVLMVFIAVFACSLFCQNKASAYFETSKDGKTQCFALQYTLSEKHNNLVTGTAGASTVTRKYSTERVCANVDGNGKVVGSLTKKSRPDGTSRMGHPKLGTGTSYVWLYTCPANGWLCGSAKEISESFDASKYNTFEELAKAVINAAPSTYANNKSTTKSGLTDNKTTTELQEEAKKQKPELKEFGY